MPLISPSFASELDGAPARNPLNILLADDSRVAQKLLKLFLSKRGHHIEVVAKDGSAALAALQRSDFDVALIDFHMPDMDGVEVVATAKASANGTVNLPYFIGITADVKGLLAHPGNCETFDLIITKPIDIAYLCEILDTFPQCVGWMNFGQSETVVVGPVEEQSTDNRQRAHRRVKVDRATTSLTLANGMAFDCKVLDLSLGGATVETHVRPALGERLFLGRTEGRVVRHTPKGIAIEFLKGR